MKIEDERDAFRVDTGIALFGDSLSAELDNVEGKKKQEIAAKRGKILERWIPGSTTEETQQNKFRDPARRA